MTFREAIRKVESTGTRTGPAFVTRRTGCSYEDITTPVYPESPRGDELREARRQLGISLREAATALQLTAEQVSGLEFGRYTFDDETWKKVFDVFFPERA